MISAPFGLYYVLHWESVTTDIKSRLSFLGKQWKEKLNQEQEAEEAGEASSAEEIAAEEPARASSEAAEPEEREAAAFAEGLKAERSPAPEAPEEDEESGGPITDEELAVILLSFGWRVPSGAESISLPQSQDPSVAAPALEELAAEVSSVMEEFAGENVSVYEEETPVSAASARRPGSAEAVSQATAVFQTFGAEGADAASGKEASGEAPENMTADAAAAEAENMQQMDAKELFGGMNQEILKEVFSEEELSELEGDATHIFKKAELEDLSDKQKEAEQEAEEYKRRQEAYELRRARRAAEKAEAERREKQRLEKRRNKARQEPVYTARDYRPIRRSRSYRTGLRGGLMYFGFVICVSIILASMAWLAADDVLSLNKDLVEADIYVGESLDMKQVSNELYNKGLIRYRKLFQVFAKLMKADTKIDPGVYTLSSKLDYNAMVHAMHQSDAGPAKRTTVMVLIPEGKTLKQTFQILAEHGVCPYETLLECAANHEFKYEFLEDIPYGAATRLEGYLFPDTYEFYASSSPEEAIDKFLSNFNAKVTSEMRLQASEMGYSVRDIVTVASLVEMEAGKETERATIASVIYNRLNSSYYPYLQIDATIQYALEERKESLTNEDLEIDSPYNTYKYPGLPPGPIANPGLASIRAALEPEDTGYYFYALNKTGSHNFFATQSQFESFVNSSEFGG